MHHSRRSPRGEALKGRLFLCAAAMGLLVLSGCGLDGIGGEEEDRVETFTVPLPGNTKMVFVKIPPGGFMMGSPEQEKDRFENEGPLHEVMLTRPIHLGRFEVTNAQWHAVMSAHFSEAGARNPDHPVEGVTWEDCRAFVEEMNLLGVGTFRLPTEAEWEYACRAGTQTRFYWGDDPEGTLINEYAWYVKNANRKTHSVGQKKANRWGLHDMAGNVQEWCRDWMGRYSEGRQTNPTGSGEGTYRTFRGGGRGYGAGYCRSAMRSGLKPTEGSEGLGFRILMEKPAPDQSK